MSGLRNLGANVKAAYQRLQDRDEDDEDSVLDVSENQDGGREQRPKRWWEFAPLCGTCLEYRIDGGILYWLQSLLSLCSRRSTPFS